MNVLDRWSHLRPDRMTTVFIDGIFAGTISGLVVLATFSAYDVATTEFLRTPSVLHAHFFDGPAVAANVDTVPRRALAYTIVHFVLWGSVGVGASYCAAVSRVYPALWYVIAVGAALILCLFLWAAGLWGVPGLGVHHLWVGALLGSATMAGLLLWRNPDLMHHPAD